MHVSRPVWYPALLGRMGPEALAILHSLWSARAFCGVSGYSGT